MRWDSNYNSNDVEDRRSERPAMGGGGMGGASTILAIGSRFGIKGILIALLVIGGMTFAGPCGHATRIADQPPAATQTDQHDPMVHFVGFVLDDVQKTWAAQMPDYTRAKLVLFREAIGSACGTATEAVGPFYCPLDKKVYIDLAFYQELRDKLGAPGDFAQAYVIAHELGHHVQDIRGLLGRHGEVSSVAIELQADCLAGAWAKDAEKRGELEVGDIDEALNAAAQIGDDTLQRKAGQQVQPERWTHGSSAQRSSNFKKGYAGGRTACGIE